MSVRMLPGSLNRRAFLRGASATGAIAVGLPFLEGRQDRSAWAQGEDPRFALFIGTANGVVQDRFWPSQEGTLDALADETNAAGALGAFARQLLFVRGISYPGLLTGSAHAQSYCQMLTGVTHDNKGNNAASSTGPSIDTLLAPVLNPDGADPLALYAGQKQGWIDERMSFIDAGQLRPAVNNPYDVYQALLEASAAASGRPTGGMGATLDELRARRQSALDLVGDELSALLSRSDLSNDDRGRLELHLSGLRDLEQSIEQVQGQLEECDPSTLDVAALEASNETYRDATMTEQIARLQLDLAAFAFSCRLNHVATLQIGDGEDQSLYGVPSNDRQWKFHHISHRIQSDGAVGNDPLAEDAHAEIDRLRLETFAYGLERFEERGLLDKSVVMWANQIADGPSHSWRNLPTILAGNPGGVLATGRLVSVDATNDRLLNTVARVLGTSVSVGDTTDVLSELLT